MTPRRILLFPLAVLVVGLVGAGIPAAGAVAQSAFGSATGESDISAYFPTQSDLGSYTSRGQLGSGRYHFETNVSACDTATDRQTLSGTATLVRSDGASLKGTVTGSEGCQHTKHDISADFTLDLTSGTRDLVSAHLTFSGAISGLVVTPGGERGVGKFQIMGSLVTTTRVGWWMLATSGNVYAFGGAPYLGNAPTPHSVATRIEPTLSRNGYWIVNEQGQVYAFGDTRWFGNADRRTWAGAHPEIVVSIASTASGNGYWLFTNKGRVVPFGDAVHYGDIYPGGLAGSIVAAVATPSHSGYYLVGSDGGVFAYGDAIFHGSAGGLRLNAPIVGMAVSPASDGYWLIASDGGVFAFGARFAGSMGGRPLVRPIVGASALGTGYVLVDNGGGVFDFSEKPFFGALPAAALTSPIGGVAAIG
jgi:hypothetical protein